MPKHTQLKILIIGCLLLTAIVAQVNYASDSFKTSGDFRLRVESNSNREDNKQNRFRNRIRFRTVGEYQVNPYFTVHARIATGNPDDPNSLHQTMGTVFNQALFSLDRVYVRFKYKDLELNAGKFSHPFKTPAIHRELVWDADIASEGIAVEYMWRAADSLTIDLMGVEYILLEQDNSGDATLSAGQAALNLSYDSISLTAAGGIYKYFKLDALDIGANGLAKIVREDNAGNAVVDIDGDGVADAFASDFTIFDGFINLTYNAEFARKFQPITLSLQFFKNLDAHIEQDTGFAAGIRLGDIKAKADFKIYYNFQSVEQDSVFSAFAQDNFLASTNFRGHLFGITYRLLDRTDLNLWGLLSKRNEPEGEGFQTRLRTDLNLSF